MTLLNLFLEKTNHRCGIGIPSFKTHHKINLALQNLSDMRITIYRPQMKFGEGRGGGSR